MKRQFMRKKAYRAIAIALSIALAAQNEIVLAVSDDDAITMPTSAEEALQNYIDEMTAESNSSSEWIDSDSDEVVVSPDNLLGEVTYTDENISELPDGYDEENNEGADSDSVNDDLEKNDEILDSPENGSANNQSEPEGIDKPLSGSIDKYLAAPIEPNAEGKIYITCTEDFIDLSSTDASVYQNATIIIARGAGVSFNLVGTDFAGIGSEAYPFMGKLEVSESDNNNSITIPLDHSFFNYLDQSAVIGEGLYLKAEVQNISGAKFTGAIFAENIVNNSGVTEPLSVSIKIDCAKDEGREEGYFGGIIGIIKSGANVTLSVNNEATTGLKIRGDGNLGLFCNTLEANSKLTISGFTGEEDFDIESTGGHVGGLVGHMSSDSSKNPATLVIDSAISLTGSISSVAASKAVGGLVGKSDYGNIILNKMVSVNEEIVAAGAGYAAGYIGDAEYNEAELELDLSNFKMSTCQITGGNHAGGLFGALKYSGKGSFDISNIDITVVHKDTTDANKGKVYQVGGLIGIYSSDSLLASLNIHNVNVSIKENNNPTSMGGLIGFIADNGKDGAVTGATAAYVQISDSNVVISGTAGTNIGGLVGEVNNAGHFVDISGEVVVSSGTGSIGGTYAGGLVGNSASGVIRISNITDLSRLKFNKAGVNYGQILGARTGSAGTIVYALGPGNGDGNSDYGWKLIRPATPIAISDIGNYGEVIRLDGTTLVENKRLGDFLPPASINSDTEVFSFYTDSHQIIPYTYHMTSLDPIVINSKRDFVTLAVAIMYGATGANGAVNKYGNTGSNLINKNITIASSLTELDLTGTGVVGLLRDNGSQTYTGNFEGNDCVIKLATGECYGYGVSDDSVVGTGQLYNHSCIGLLGILNGNVSNLTIDGNIDFGMNTGGVATYCGGIAGKVNASTVNNVTIKASTNYHTGASGSSIPVSNVGGFFGGSAAASKTINFNDCHLNASFNNTCTAYTYYLGGYIGLIEHTIIVNANDSDIENTTISAGYTENSMVGGFISNISSTGNKINLTNFEIDGLKITNDAITSSGGFLGYKWNSTTFIPSGVVIKNSELTTNGAFGGLVYISNGNSYWKIDDNEGIAGITFDSGITLKGLTSAGTPSALLLENGNTTFVELYKDGLSIKDGAVSASLTGGDYFDDLVGVEKNDGVISIGLTETGASEPVLLDVDGFNSWSNKCSVNGKTTYTNSKARYYYNLDYYRKPDSNNKSTLELGATIDNEAELLCWSVAKRCNANLSSYFYKSGGGVISGEIDLTGVSFYPVGTYVDIKDATINFGYCPINDVEVDNNNKPLNDATKQHYQMQSGLFNGITNEYSENLNETKYLDVNGLVLRGTFGPYSGNNGGVILVSQSSGATATYKTVITLNNIELDGIRCANTNVPLLISSLGDYTTLSVTNVYTTDKYTENGITSHAASALVGKVGSEAGVAITVNFSEIGLDARIYKGAETVYGTYNTIFTKATLMTEFIYSDQISGGSYNFEKNSELITYGKEISNTSSGRNKYNDNETSQYCYFDTYGTNDYVEDEKGPGKKTVAIADRFSTGYRPYVGHEESGNYHELDINQKAYYIIDGCGTYGHPYHIRTIEEDGEVIAKPEHQMIAIMNLLSGQGNGSVVNLNKLVLSKKNEAADLHSSLSNNDTLYIKSGGAWYPAEKNGKHYKKKDNSESVSDEDVLAYIRNAYYEIDESFDLDMSVFSGIGENSTDKAFSGVIIGKNLGDGVYPTITLKCQDGKSVNSAVSGGLIRYSQGSIVKNINICIDSVNLDAPSSSKTPSCFGGVIGWTIGGDNIIDNVSVTATDANSVYIAGNNNWLVAIGGYVGYVSSNDCMMGGGVAFRNITSAGLLNVNYKNNKSTETVNVDLTLETYGINSTTTDRYYWNPYVGRVLEGYACAEKDNSKAMGDNTDKNYKIPKLDKKELLNIKVDKSTTYNASLANNNKQQIVPTRSTVTVDSTQDLWVLSSLINSGAAGRATNDFFKGTTNANSKTIDAYYLGRSRTGSYDHVGSIDWSDEDKRDESYNWGGCNSAWFTCTYLGSYTDNYEASCFLTIDVEYRQMTIKNGSYDLTSYGNGYRGIGLSYYYDGKVGSGYHPQKLRMIRLAGNAVIGNNSSINFQRHIYEYSNEPILKFDNKENPFMVRQAGFFNTYNQKNANGSVNNMTIKGEVTSNQTVNRTVSGISLDNNRINAAFGIFAGRTSYNYDNKLTIDNVDILEDSLIVNGYFAGGLIGKIVDYIENENPYVFSNCDIDGLCIQNAVDAGSFVGHTPRDTQFTDCNVKNTIISSRNEPIKCNIGGLVGEVNDKNENKDNKRPINKGKLKVENVNITNLKLFTGINASADSSVGGIVGYVNNSNSNSFNQIVIDKTDLVSCGYSGGLIGYKNSSLTDSISSVEISNSYIVISGDKNAGAIAGLVNNGSLNVFNIRSKDNIVGYLICKDSAGKTVLDSSMSTIKDSNGIIDFSLLSTSNIGLRESNAAGKYWTYDELKADSDKGDLSKKLTSSNIGIWVGNGNNKTIKIVSATRLGDYSAVKNVAVNGKNSYVIYADYTGKSPADSNGNSATGINVNPNTGITFDKLNSANELTSDGAYIEGDKAIGMLIMEDNLKNSFMEGYFGGEITRPMDSVVTDFKNEYGTILSTYKIEESTTTYKGTDIPILVLETTSQAELNSIINKYISILTNNNQLVTARYNSITPNTYYYNGSKWVKAANQSLLVSDGKLKVNPGKYDNTKNQITIIDVAYNSPITDSTDVYHLYIPVLVKKVMDISFGIKITNGATGFESAYDGSNATLASFGEDFTARLNYTYNWTAAEWNDNIASGVNLLWSFDKQVNVDKLAPLDLSKIRMTLVDMNTHGISKTFFQSTGSIIAADGTVLFSGFEDFNSVPICDLLPLVEEEGTEDNPGVFKKVSEDDTSATIRRWDKDSNSFIYYALKDEENDEEGTIYYNVKLSGTYNAEDSYPVTETYYLVINCTEGTGMYNKMMTLGTTKLEGGVPSHIDKDDVQDAIYILGNFYTLENMALETRSENATQVMSPGANDYIDVTVSATASAKSTTLENYVVNRPVYFRYAIHLTNQETTPVEIVASSSFASSVKVGDLVLNAANNLDEVDEGYTFETSGSNTYVVIKTAGKNYIGKDIEIKVRYLYDDNISLLSQFPVRRMTESDNFGVKFSATSSIAYEYLSLGNTAMSLNKNDTKIYYTQENSEASMSYDSYNVVDYVRNDGNTSQLGLNYKDSKQDYMNIKSRALFDATTVSSLDRSNKDGARYPYYLEGTLSLGQKTEIDKPNDGIGKTYANVKISDYLSNIKVSSGDANVITSGDGLGLQDDGATFKFRIELTDDQIAEIFNKMIVVNIDYDVLEVGLEGIDGGHYANYKVSLNAVLKNKELTALCNEPSDYLIYTNAMVYLGIIGVTDVDSN